MYICNFKVIWETYLKTPGTVTEPAEAQAFVGTTNDWSGWFMRNLFGWPRCDSEIIVQHLETHTHCI